MFYNSAHESCNGVARVTAWWSKVYADPWRPFESEYMLTYFSKIPSTTRRFDALGKAVLGIYTGVCGSHMTE